MPYVPATIVNGEGRDAEFTVALTSSPFDPTMAKWLKLPVVLGLVADDMVTVIAVPAATSALFDIVAVVTPLDMDMDVD